MIKEEMKQTIADIIKVLDEKKAENIMLLDFEGNSDFTDYMIICDAESITQIKALARYVDGMMKDKGIKTISRRDERSNNPWVLLDYLSIVVNIFQKETREFYNIEKLWSEAKIVDYSTEGLLV